MRSARPWAFAGTVMLVASAANAADAPAYRPPAYQQPAYQQPVYQQPVYQQPVYQPPPPPPVVVAPPPPVAQPICVSRGQANLYPSVPFCAEEQFAMGWYLRGDIGFSNQQVSKLENAFLPNNANHISSDFSSAGIFGVGLGMQFNNWLRADVTGEYRMKADYNGLDVIGKEMLFLLNAYMDLGTWWCVTPFVGAGIGFARVTISDFIDNSISKPSIAFGGEESQWNFAWALHAGLAYQATNNLAIEFAYRYTNLGDGMAGDVITYTGDNVINNPTTFKNITSHDFKLGLRWTCCDEPAPPPPPVPMYQPPVISKG
jgi:opacity protein-like surface antigen